MYAIWFISVNKGKLMDRFNLVFRRSRTIKVNVRTRSGRTIERFIVPDNRGILHVGKGVYAYVHEVATINARYRIPEITILETQIHPATPEIVAKETEIEVKVAKGDGTFENTKMKIPNYFLSVAHLQPETLQGHVAQEMKQALDSHIVSDVLTASDKTMKKIELMFIMILVNLALTFIVGIVIYNAINGMQSDMEVVKYAATQTNP